MKISEKLELQISFELNHEELEKISDYVEKRIDEINNFLKGRIIITKLTVKTEYGTKEILK